jgi:protein-L-isoaspartate O-methyltransferase
MDLQPDQRPALWDDHVSEYEAVFEPLTCAFAAAAIERLAIATNDRVVDVGAGCGGAALMLSRRGARVLAVDASWRMADRARARLDAATEGRPPRAAVAVMDGMALAVADAAMDAALSGGLELARGTGPLSLRAAAFVGVGRATRPKT